MTPQTRHCCFSPSLGSSPASLWLSAQSASVTKLHSLNQSKYYVGVCFQLWCLNEDFITAGWCLREGFQVILSVHVHGNEGTYHLVQDCVLIVVFLESVSALRHRAISCIGHWRIHSLMSFSFFQKYTVRESNIYSPCKLNQHYNANHLDYLKAFIYCTAPLSSLNISILYEVLESKEGKLMN